MRQVNAADMLEDAIEYIRHLQRQMEAVRLLHPNVRVEPFVSRLDSQQGAARADDAGEDGRDWGLGERGDGGGAEGDGERMEKTRDGQLATRSLAVAGRGDGDELEDVKDVLVGLEARNIRDGGSGGGRGVDKTDDQHTLQQDRLSLSIT
ncbi:hypothetical protein CLOM_g14714 [Closterium sp. NIES-68]|nr:hypothetical protein CLOM_g14714 [Closterium sp. NIES-68]GJP65164.1 hypothetical protein CLOP_g22067 [Closterium sp. NIES-67]